FGAISSYLHPAPRSSDLFQSYASVPSRALSQRRRKRDLDGGQSPRAHTRDLQVRRLGSALGGRGRSVRRALADRAHPAADSNRRTVNTALERLLRPQAHGRRHERLDLGWLLGLGLLLIGAGVGLRDPWPPDEPRFALIARDMLASGEWLIPGGGAGVYGDKPPLFFWIEAALLWLTGSLRLAVFLPGLLAGLGTVVLVYDLARRLWSREIAFAAGLGLLLTVQFVWQARQGQIDATLCFFTTLSLYGLLRHLLLGPRWGWFVLGWAGAGVGVITKGVGFLPLAILPLHAVLRRMSPRAEDRAAASSVWGWAAGPLALAATVSLWLAPMLIAAANDPAIAAYRDEILYGQTVERYIDARHHHEPF